jgi:hypothetical protein
MVWLKKAAAEAVQTKIFQHSKSFKFEINNTMYVDRINYNF